MAEAYVTTISTSRLTSTPAKAAQSRRDVRWLILPTLATGRPKRLGGLMRSGVRPTQNNFVTRNTCRNGLSGRFEKW
ncbi:uncharacterized protein PHALS_14861 [Plasmopara halstedii]|uniref:Uncharacterized protein n=1 Tax=Plasmopara halstedii TaxID=4781 RepID=A0A0N7L743_PLAHL|nr:uncharacterized protein PHALS_14861 [Plasmopara halstedii]CEG46035.1 hypothetical protein PHALS_14861 [Plasmopara halstedii]|eukprot:XP_024582404.1 hypothetical protein PHALS_14861 [Plasmopara halstedii]